MRTNFITYSILILILVVIHTSRVRAQINWEETENIVENVQVITDRDAYCVNEAILFKAYNTSADSIKNIEWSKVLYIEIITPDGRAIVQEKYNYSREGCSGELDIPSNALTGNYYLRAYTKWMRNFSPYQYYYKLVRIVNPHSQELLQPLYSNHSDYEAISDSVEEDRDLAIELEKTEYGTREKVKINILSEANFLNTFSISVIKSSLSRSRHNISAKIADSSFAPLYYPETRGISISGRIVHEEDSTPVMNNPLHLTVFKDVHEILSATSDRSGRFAITLPDLEGEYEIYITTKNTDDGRNPIILIDNDFCTRVINLPYVPFKLSDDEKQMFAELCINTQLNSMYTENIGSAETTDSISEIPFYGKPEYTLYLEEYIELPTIQDYIYELVPTIGIRQKNKSLYLKVIGVYPDLQYHDPLILIDLLAVYDVNRILKVPPQKINRIEVINIPYIRGNKTYGGIVSFFSKEGDLAGIDLPSWGNFIKFKVYNPQSNQQFSLPANNRIPVARNCLYWNPSIPVHENTETEIEFYTGDTSGEYIILLKGLDENGQLIVKSVDFTVSAEGN